METCRALRQLHRRSMNLHLVPPMVSGEDSFHDVPGTGEEISDPKHIRQQRKPAHSSTARNPTLARITIQNSSKPSQIALVKPATRRKKSFSASELSTVSSKTSPKATSPARPSRPPPLFSGSRAAPSTQRSQPPSGKSTARSKHHHPSNTTTRLSQTRLPTVNLRPSPDAGPTAQSPPASAVLAPETLRRRAPVPTYYSVASDGTKIGEIPLEKWAEKFDFEAMAAMNREAEVNGWPLVPLASEQNKKKPRTGLLRVFRRKDR
nr:hypothetical protein CFP56_38922 [Quercus suber]